MIYDFLKGKTAKRIEQLIKSTIQQTSDYHFESICDIEYKSIDPKDDRFFYKKGSDEYLMFAYKKAFNTLYHGFRQLPVYHVCECRTREEYSGFTYAASMPVEIYCRDEKKLLEKPQSLKLCTNCVTASQKGVFSLFSSSKLWYEYVLEYAVSKNEIAIKTLPSGYVVMWKQISEAVRERIGFKCENCDIHLKDEKYYLEVHHKDYNKRNNKIENLKALCVLCHATVDNTHLNNYRTNANFLKVNSFLDSYTNYIKENNKSNLNKWNSNI